MPKWVKCLLLISLGMNIGIMLAYYKCSLGYCNETVCKGAH